jgi:hypothetical protein
MNNFCHFGIDSGWNCYSDENSENLNKIDNINKVKSRWQQAKAALEDAQYLEELIYADYVRTIRAHKTTWDYRIPSIKSALDELTKKKKSEQKNLAYIGSCLKEDFFEDTDADINVHDIISGGYEGYYWQFYFNVYECEYIIQIPVRAELTTKNIGYAHEGKFVFLKRTSPHCTKVLFDDWTEAGLAKQIKSYIHVNESV